MLHQIQNTLFLSQHVWALTLQEKHQTEQISDLFRSAIKRFGSPYKNFFEKLPLNSYYRLSLSGLIGHIK